jgi:Mg2+ and Co2+ transporter CorA
MIEKTLSQIEAKISSAESVSAERKAELLKLLGTLKTEVSELSKTHGEQADSIANFASLSAHEATRTNPNQHLRELSNQGLQSSVSGFEQSHPRLVQIVNAISKMLSDLGI